MTKLNVAVLVLALAVSAMALAAIVGRGVAASPTPTFSNFLLTPLPPGKGDSEPAVSIGPDGTVVLGGLDWNLSLFQTDIWKGSFGSAPTALGPIDAHIGKGIGGGDEDLDFGSTGTMHASTLMFFFNPTGNAAQLGVSAIACPNFASATDLSHCKAQIIDTTQADREWITSVGKVVYISYHDSGSSTLIHVQRSLDDGMTWAKVGNPVVGQGMVTGGSTFNNDQGQLVADPTTGNVYAVFAAGEPGIQKATSTAFNHVYVSASTDMGMTWTAHLVFTAPMFTGLNNVFPMLAVDPSNGNLVAAWSDGHSVSVSMSTDHATTWSPAVQVNSGNAATAIFPNVAVRDGLIDVAYYGTPASSDSDPNAVWNTYMAQSTDGVHFSQSVVSAHPNHVGVICVNGTGCPNPLVTRTLLDLFEIAINAQGKAAVIYTDDTLATFVSRGITFPLPQVIVGYQN